MIRRIALLCSITMLLGCAETPTAPKPAPKSEALPSSKAKPSPRPVARWDHRPEAARWTDKTLTALSSHGAPLINMVPSDVATYCPAYAENGPGERKAFWVGLLSALAKHESTWRPDVSGGDGSANLSCAVRIMAVTVPRDGVISAGRGGIAADWGPFTQAAKRSEMAEWTRTQPYCQG